MGLGDRADESFAALLRRCREGRRMTQAELAERSGLTSQAISMLERGVRRAPRVKTVELLADALSLDGPERETFHAAARSGPSPEDPQPEAAPEAAPARPATGRRAAGWRWGGRAAVLAVAALTALVVATSLGWWPPRTAADPPATTNLGDLIGARVENWPSADQAVGPLQTQRYYHDTLPASFQGSPEAQLPRGGVPIVSYRNPTVNVARYVASVKRPLILIFGYNPEPRMSAPAFVSTFEAQSRLIRSVRNANVRVATSSMVYQYRTSLNPGAATCGYIPPPAYVDYYLSAVYDPYLEGLDKTDQGGFVVWQNCTRGLHRPRGLVEFGLGLGAPTGGPCKPESERTAVMYHDLDYLHATMPDLAVIEYWWHAGSKAPCSRSWQFPKDSSTADLWRTLANRAFGL